MSVKKDAVSHRMKFLCSCSLSAHGDALNSHFEASGFGMKK